MKLRFYFEEAALHIAVEQDNIEIVKLILSQPKIDINSISVLFTKFISFKKHYIFITFVLKFSLCSVFNCLISFENQ